MMNKKTTTWVKFCKYKKDWQEKYKLVYIIEPEVLLV